MENGDRRDTAGVIAFPPLIYGIPLLVTLLAEGRVSSRRLPSASRVLSAGFFATAVAVVAPAIAAFRKAGTPIDPFEETSALVEDGPFAFSRNPLYIGLTLAYMGVALAARRVTPMVVLPAVLWLMNEGVISREERYLERKFGESYRAYRNRVPRWL